MSRFPIFAALSLVALCRLVAGPEEGVLSVFREHCVRCHGEGEKVKGKVNLVEIDHVARLGEKGELLQTLVEVIEYQEMPPEDEPPLDDNVRAELLRALKHLRASSRQQGQGYEHAPMRRMNRFQYNNAVVDLFQLKSVVFALPEAMMREHRNYFKPETGKMPDVVTVGSRPLGKSQLIEKRLNGVAPFPQDLRAEHGFDNRGDHLSLSPLLMESFLKLGRSVVESDDFNPKNVGIWNDFFAPPAESDSIPATLNQRLSRFLTRAFRRPVEPSQLRRYQEYALSKLKKGGDFSETMRGIAAAVIASPRFLYLYETANAQPRFGELDAYERAARLSWFLWGSIPDQQLLNLAASGKLMEEAVLRSEFERMLKDHKVKRFCDSFPSQWLQLERIISSTPNEERFPGFYFLKYRDSMHMMMEPLLLFETVLIENLPVTQLLHSDFTYRSDLLEEAYGELAIDALPDRVRTEVAVLNFRRRPVKDLRNGGVITNAAVMTMTSGPERTQPITRGAWLASVIFNDPPEPPPADVPPLGEKPTADEAHLTLRERLALHRERADCRGCHEKIDPLGFALENYDAIGNWRSVYENGREVDVSGQLFRKHSFAAVDEFKEGLLAEKDRFTRGLAGHLLSFALARALGPADQLVVDQIAATVAADEYRLQSLLWEVVSSEPFLTKTNPESELAAAE